MKMKKPGVSQRQIITPVLLMMVAYLVLDPPGLAAQTLDQFGGYAALPPAALVDTTYPTQAGQEIIVGPDEDLRIALAGAQLGDTIVLSPGATYVGPFTLPSKSGSGWIVIRTSATLPPEGTRVTPADAPLMPKLLAPPGGSAVTSAPGAHHYRFVGIELRPTSGTFLYNLVLLGNGETSVDQFPHHIVFDRCFLHGDPQAGTRRGIAMNGKSLAVIDSYLADFKEVGTDTQAIGGWGGPGPFKIANNYLEAAGENVMFGGSDPSIPDVVPSDIEIRSNHFMKPLTWRIGDPSYAGTPWTVKNLLELKNARRVLIDGNLFEYGWAHAQSGTAIVFTGRNQNGTAPWSVVEDVTFTNNTVRHAGGGLVILGLDDNFPNQLSKRFLIRNNAFVDISSAAWGGNGWLFSIFRGPADVVIEHNVGLPDKAAIAASGEPAPNFVFRDNIIGHGLYGIFGDAIGQGNIAINYYLPGADFRRNIIINPESYAASYPQDTIWVPTIEAVGFRDAPNGDYTLAATSPYKGAATDGLDIGLTKGIVEPPPPPAAVVAISNPLDGATIKRGTLTAVTAVVNVPSGTTVKWVKFYFSLGSAPLAQKLTDRTAPYVWNWRPAGGRTPRTYHLMAEAYSSTGALLGTSSIITVLVP